MGCDHKSSERRREDYKYAIFYSAQIEFTDKYGRTGWCNISGLYYTNISSMHENYHLIRKHEAERFERANPQKRVTNLAHFFATHDELGSSAEAE